MRTFIIVLLVLATVSCSTTRTDASRHEYFSSLIGKSLPLLKELKLCLNPDDINFSAFRTIELNYLEQHCHSRKIANVPVNTLVKIQSVKKLWMPISGSSWYALGEIQIADTKYEFEYFYGYLDIRRAPWEDESIPLKRAVPK